MLIKFVRTTAKIGVGTVMEVSNDAFTPGNKFSVNGSHFEVISTKMISEDTMKIVGVNFIAVVKILG